MELLSFDTLNYTEQTILETRKGTGGGDRPVFSGPVLMSDYAAF